MTLMRFDPFRELDGLAEQTLSVGARALRSMPMGAMRRGDELIAHLDVPGVRPDAPNLLAWSVPVPAPAQVAAAAAAEPAPV